MNKTIVEVYGDMGETRFALKRCVCSSIDWGDGYVTSFSNNYADGTYDNITHTYKSITGQRVITIFDNSELKIRSSESSDFAKLVSVIQLSCMLTSCEQMFRDCSFLTDVSKATLPPNVSKCNHMFDGCTSLKEMINWGDNKHIDNCGFMYMSSGITNICDNTFPHIGQGAFMFDSCKNLSEISRSYMNIATTTGIFDGTNIKVINELKFISERGGTFIFSKGIILTITDSHIEIRNATLSEILDNNPYIDLIENSNIIVEKEGEISFSNEIVMNNVQISYIKNGDNNE